MLDCRGDADRHAIDFLDARGDRPEGRRRLASRSLDPGDLAGDLFRCLGGLLGQGLHFGGYDREAAADRTGTSRFDSAIERKQVSLPGDRRDQPDRVVDPGYRGAQFLNGDCGLPSLRDGTQRELGRAVDLLADLLYR